MIPAVPSNLDKTQENTNSPISYEPILNQTPPVNNNGSIVTIPPSKYKRLLFLKAIILLFAIIGVLALFVLATNNTNKLTNFFSLISKSSAKTLTKVPLNSDYVRFTDDQQLFSFNIPPGWDLTTAKGSMGLSKTQIPEPITFLNPQSLSSTSVNIGAYGFLSNNINAILKEQSNVSTLIPLKSPVIGYAVFYVKDYSYLNNTGAGEGATYFISGKNATPGSVPVTVEFDINITAPNNEAVNKLLKQYAPIFKKMAYSTRMGAGIRE